MMSSVTVDPNQYIVKKEPYYEAVGREIALYEAAYNARMPMMLKGPTGCGKSRFVEYMAYKLGKPLITVACNEDMTATDLVGRFLLDKDGTKWQDGPLATAARIGAMTGGRIKAPVVFTGGGALVSGMHTALEHILKETVTLCPEPQMTGALGAAILAARQSPHGSN